ncbi:AzlD domain-containing protein [Paracandidimonas soli]|uniref:Branched-subunit amino acid transport protein AzlD n=1 Tax=Paracandidimonas soli TaxID=1917182 RepID=A0A4R3V3Z0_9BURK|nr:AzlD domain-containing protein [Paracandidimonas soli]TCU98410.1 branched-subunit amino acid transport protein AzlD [Paracandidimonas soli]
MTLSPELVIVLCGAGTFLLRFVPLWRSRSRQQATDAAPDRPSALHRFFQGIGPAAITALLLVSLWPFFVASGSWQKALSAGLALLVIYIGKRLTHGLAGPTLLGAGAYGLLMHLLQTA